MQVFPIPTQKTTQATPWKIIILNPKNEGWMEEDVPFQFGDFEVPAVKFLDKGRFSTQKKLLKQLQDLKIEDMTKVHPFHG